jgi:hypothetical protein
MSAAGVVKYLDKSKTLVTISTIPQAGGSKQKSISVQGIIPPEYGFSIKNDFEPLLSTSNNLSDFNKATQAFNQLVAQTDLSVVPYSPMVWMGAKVLQINEMTLHFVCFDNPEIDVHKPLMDLLAMSLPRGSGFEIVGMLNAPPAVEVKIGNVISWKPCFIESAIISEKAPYSKDGYGMSGEAKITIIRRDYIFSDDLSNSGKEPRVLSTNPTMALGMGDKK